MTFNTEGSEFIKLIDLNQVLEKGTQHMRVVGIIQARMGSTRLPGKILHEIAGTPMLARVVERLARSSTLESVLIATTTRSADDPVASLCRNSGFAFYRGNEMDVLDRYYQAAREAKADAVVRITADCPLIDPGVVDLVVGTFLENPTELDYACNFLPKRSFPRGLDTEVLHFSTLETTWREAVDPHFREHVTLFIYRHPERFRIRGLCHSEDLSKLRWTVDTPDDMAFVRTIYEHFGDDRFDWNDVLAVLNERPEWAQINAHIDQKALPTVST